MRNVKKLLTLALLALAACGTPALGQELPSNKVFVCKYETTPGGGERLQTGQNPISVSINALPVGVTPAVGAMFNDAQGRSIVIAFDTGQDEPDVSECPPPGGGTTTTTAAPTTTTSTTIAVTTTTSTSTTSTSSTSTTSTTTGPTTTTTLPTPGLFSFPAVTGVCTSTGNAVISITFPARPELEGQVGTLTMETSIGQTFTQSLTFLSGATVTIPYPAGILSSLSLTYVLGTQTATAIVTFPVGCAPATTTMAPATTTTTTPTPNTFAVTTTTTLPPGVTTTTKPPTTTTTQPNPITVTIPKTK